MPVVVDSSVWIDHLRSADKLVYSLLINDEIVLTETILGELLVGSLLDRPGTMAQLLDLPRVRPSSFQFIFLLVEENGLFGAGLNWGDVSILASCYENNLRLFTRDARLHKAALKLKIAF